MYTSNFNSNKKRFEHQSDDIEIDKRIQNNDKWIFCLLMIFPDLIAIFFGYVAHDDYLDPHGAGWLFGSFFLAICAGLIIRYLFKDAFGGHIGITIASVIVALAVAILGLILTGIIMPFIVYLVLFTFAICA